MIIVLAAALLFGQDYNDAANFCANPRNGGDISACSEMLLATETGRMERYLKAAVSAVASQDTAEDGALAARLIESQATWQAYADAACGSVLAAGIFGDVDCRSKLTQERTYHLWVYYVSAMGKSPLGEPVPFRVGASELPEE